MKNIVFIIFFLFASLCSAQYNRQGRSVSLTGKYETIKPKSTLGLESVFLFQNLSTAKFNYQTSASNNVQFYTYSFSLADKIPFSENNITTNGSGNYVLSNLSNNQAIVVEDNGLFLCFWILDYSQYIPTMSSITTEVTEDDCTDMKLVVGLSYPAMTCRGVTGISEEIDRIFTLKYNTLELSDHTFKPIYVEKEINNPGTDIIISQPLTNTTFTLSGDQFAQSLASLVSITSEEYEAQAVSGKIVAEQKNNKTGIYEEKTQLGGSAPIDIRFKAIANEPTTYFYTWYIYNIEDPENPIGRYTDQEINYTFSNYGIYDVLLELANEASTCIDTMKIQVQVAESKLEIPNFMTPKDPNGRNKTFKVVHKSILRYECTIFNRWGNKLFHTTDINQVWDGKYKGQYVEPGAYFYSIIAEGADGVKYRRGGDINVL